MGNTRMSAINNSPQGGIIGANKTGASIMIGNGHTAPATGKEDRDAQTLLANVEEFIYDESVQPELVSKDR